MDRHSLNLMSRLRTGEQSLPEPGFYHCEANVSLLCFGYDSRLNACYEGIGDEKYSIGSYWPTRTIASHHLAQYRERSAFAMEQCSTCSQSPFCGGGCQVRGRKHNLTYMRPYCDNLHAETRYVMQNWES